MDYIDAPMPFIIGTSKQIWNSIKKQRGNTLSPDLIVFDVEEDKLICNEQLTDFPKNIADSVQNSITLIMEERNKIPADQKVFKNIH